MVRFKPLLEIFRFACVSVGVSVASCVLLVGCGKSESLRMPISGLVTLGGSNIESGTIGFFPARGTSGPSATSLIRAGRYRLTTENGPHAGAYRAEITIDQIDANDQGRSGSSASSSQPSSGSALVDPKKRITNQSNASTRINARMNTGEPNRKWNVDCVVPADGPMELNFDL